VLFRVRKTLEKGKKKIAPGSFTRLEWLTARGREIMISVGAVSEVGAPPLAVVPGWKARSEKLARVGIEDAAQFIDADTDVLCEALGRQPRTVGKYRNELMEWMTVDKPAAG